MTEQVRQIVEIIRKKTDFVPAIAIVLGSGLGDYGESMDVVCEIPYSDLPDFPVSTVSGHVGRFLLGYIDEVPVVCMQGRVHVYEGYTTHQVALPIRVMHALGAKVLFESNAAGGIKDTYRPGTLALITDHISMFVPNPLIGPNDDEEGVRFPDMTEVYDRRLRTIMQQAAISCGVMLDQGIYCQLPGPSFETPAEIRMIHMLGADMVGMSTVTEVIVARHMGMRICGISLITNFAAGISALPISHEEVYETAQKASERFKSVVTAAVKAIYQSME